MRKAAILPLVFFSVIGSAEAGTITKFGAVNALTNINQMISITGTAGFDEGPVSGGVPANTYVPLGMLFRTGLLTTILPGCSTLGSASIPSYSTGAYFPAPIAGGATANAVFNFHAGVVTFSVPVTQVGLTAGKNGSQFLTAWSQSGVMIGQVNWVPSNDAAFVGIDTLGVPVGMVAYGNDDLWNGATYDVGGLTIIADNWVWGPGGCVNNAGCNDSNPCTDDVCTMSQCFHTNNAVACNDNNACTTNDVCQGGACGGAPVVCAPLDACHLGVCDAVTGMCSNPAKPDGDPCDDNDACTQMDACQAGTCTGANPVVCAALDTCHDMGMCSPVTGMCSDPVKPDGSACSDSDGCTQTDTCLAGVCSGANPVMCPPPDGCHTAGTCDQVTGMCSNPAKPDGDACDDNNSCTQMDACQAGVCTGASAVMCMASDSCHDVGMCDPTTAMCTNPAKPDGVACDGGTCKGGVCTMGGSSGSTGSGSSSSSGDPGDPGGCGCGVPRSNEGGALGLGVLLLLAARRRRRL